MYGWEKVLNKASTTFRALPDEDKADLTEAKAIRLMIAQPSMIKRPVIEVGGEVFTGFKADTVGGCSTRDRRGRYSMMTLASSPVVERGGVFVAESGRRRRNGWRRHRPAHMRRRRSLPVSVMTITWPRLSPWNGWRTRLALGFDAIEQARQGRIAGSSNSFSSWKGRKPSSPACSSSSRASYHAKGGSFACFRGSLDAGHGGLVGREAGAARRGRWFRSGDRS